MLKPVNAELQQQLVEVPVRFQWGEQELGNEGDGVEKWLAYLEKPLTTKMYPEVRHSELMVMEHLMSRDAYHGKHLLWREQAMKWMP